MLSASAVHRQTLHSEIAMRLRDLIVTGELGPGQKIPERELCERFEISRTPFREALKVLATEGIIQLLPQRGARVSTITDQEIGDLFPIIATLESLAGELACATITDQEIAAIAQLHQAMIDAYGEHENLEYSRLNREIHLAIVAATRNKELQTLYGNLELRIRNIRHTVRQQPQDWAQAIRDHEDMLAALGARDAPVLARVMRDHVLNTARAVRNSVEEIDRLGDAPKRASR